MKKSTVGFSLVMAVWAAIVSQISFAQQERNVTQWIRESQTALAAEKFPEAENLAQKAVDMDPAYAPAWRQFGLALLRGDKPEQSVPAFERAVDLDPEDSTAMRGLAEAYWRIQKNNLAVRTLSGYLRLKPDDVAGWRDMGVWMTRLERTDQAISAFQRVVELAPEDAGAWRELGVLYQRKGLGAEAAEALEKAVALAPSNPATRRDLGWILWSLDRREEALANLSKAIENGVDSRERVIFQVVARLSEEGADAEALDFLRRVAPETPPLELGLELARSGRLQAAKAILASVWETGEKSPDVGLYLAYVRAVNGQFAGLAGYLEPMLASDELLTRERADLALETLRLGGTRPEVPDLADRLEDVLDDSGGFVERITDILEMTAEGHRVRGRPDEALMLYRRVLDRDPDRMGWIWVVILSEEIEGRTPFRWLDEYESKVSRPALRSGIKGLRADRRGEDEIAISALRESLSLEPFQPILRQTLFNTLLERGRVSEARKEANWFARKVEEGETALRSHLAEILTRLGETREALFQWRMLHQARPDVPYYAIEAASALFHLNRPDEAVDMLRPMTETTPHPRIFEMLAEIASARGHTEAAVEWAARGLAVTPSQGLRRYYAENLEILETDPPEALAAALDFLKHDPGYVPLTLLAGRMLDTPGDSGPAASFYRRLLERAPAFLPAITALRDIQTRAGNLDDAVDLARTRTEVQPGNGDAWIQYANSLGQKDRFRKAFNILRPMDEMAYKNVSPVLVYRSISAHPYAGRNSVDQIQRHIARLDGDGMVFVNTFSRLEKPSDERRVMMILVDPDETVIEALDPVLRKYDARVVYAGNAAVPELTLSGRPLSERTATLLASDRWRLASGGPSNRRRLPVDAEGVLGNPLTHPVMVDGKIETAQTFSDRLVRALTAAGRELDQEDDRILVYPDGDFGQRSLDTTVDTMQRLHAAVSGSFTHAVYFDDTGFYLPERNADPLRIAARAVPPKWGADELATYVSEDHPVTRARFELARLLYWNGQNEAAAAMFDRAGEAGADRLELAFNRGLNADRQGDLPTAAKYLREANELDPDSMRIQSALERTEDRRRPLAQVFLQGWEDNEDRGHFRVGALGDLFVHERLRLGASVDRNRWETDSEGREYGTRMGVRTLAYLAPQIWLSGRLWSLEMDNLSDHWGGDAALRLPNPFLSGFLSLVLAREEIETLEALRAEIDAELYGVRRYTRLFDVFDLFADLSFIKRSDGNDTTQIDGRLLYRLKEWPYAGIGWRFRFADSDIDPPEYWAPEQLQQHQLHVNLRGTWKRLNGSLSADVGYARERYEDWRFVWGTRAGLDLSLAGRLSLGGEVGWFETPSYERLYGRMGLTGRF